MEKEEGEGIGPNEMPQSLVQFQDPREFSDMEPTGRRGSFRGRSLLFTGRRGRLLG